jgi:transposase
MQDTPAHPDVTGVRLRVPDRSQVAMNFQCADDLIPADHPARAVWRVVDAMDLSDFLAPVKARDGVRGRDATDPRLLVALWLYATVRGVGSARELARLCAESKPFIWLCGGVGVNHRLLSDFRVGRGGALDRLLTDMVATLVKHGLVKVRRISQDGVRVRADAGASSFRRGQTLQQLLQDAREQVANTKALLEDPARSAGLSARKKAARGRAAADRLRRVEKAIATLPQLAAKQEKLAKKVAARDKAKKLKEPRASTTDPDARVMKMANGGFNPAVNVQFAVDAESRAVVGVDAVGEGNDHHLSEPMRRQVEQRTGRKVEEQLIDGGYLVKEDVERAAAEGVTLFVPPKPPRNKEDRGSEYDPMAGESRALTEWRARMGSAEGQEIYRQRAATSETVNADFREHRGLDRLRVRGLPKARCVALWMALAYNATHFAAALAGTIAG